MVFSGRSRRPGFTLIELLIVVAIIAILAAIAVPNFLEAQTRAKVSRALADMRSLATAIEAYRIDTNRCAPRPIVPVDPGLARITPPVLGAPPTTLDDSRPRSLSHLTSPVAYITSPPADPFESHLEPPFNTIEYWDDLFTEVFFDLDVGKGGYVLFSVGPDTYGGWGNLGLVYGYPIEPPLLLGSCRVVFDITNGTLSPGNIFRFSHNASPPGLLPRRTDLPVGL